MRQNWAAPVFHQPAVRVQQNIAQTLHTHYKHSRTVFIVFIFNTNGPTWFKTRFYPIIWHFFGGLRIFLLSSSTYFISLHSTDLVCAVCAIKKIFTAVVGLKRKRPVLVQTLLIHISAAKERSNSIHNFFWFTFCFLSETWNKIWKWTRNNWKIVGNPCLRYHFINNKLYLTKSD